MGDPWYEVAFGALYPLIYGHRDRAEAQLCLETLQDLVPFCSGGGTVLDLGCGEGRHLEILAAGGIAAVGLDLSGTLLKSGRSRDDGLVLVRADMRKLCFPAETMESVLSLFTAFGYFGPLEDNTQAVAEISRVLQSGGHWFLDYFDCDGVKSELGGGKSLVRDRTVGSFRIHETRKYRPAEGQVFKDVLVTVDPQFEGSPESQLLPREGLRYTEKVAVFSLEEMDVLASVHGLVRVASAGSYCGLALGEGDRWLLIYQKRGG